MRNYIDLNFDCFIWELVEYYYCDLFLCYLVDKDVFYIWLKDKSEFEVVLEENMVWCYICMIIDMMDEEKVKNYQFFVMEIQLKFFLLEDQLNWKMMELLFVEELEKENEVYCIYFWGVCMVLELFCEENIFLEMEFSMLSQEYGVIFGKQIIEYQGKMFIML